MASKKRVRLKILTPGFVKEFCTYMSQGYSMSDAAYLCDCVPEVISAKLRRGRLYLDKIELEPDEEKQEEMLLELGRKATDGTDGDVLSAKFYLYVERARLKVKGWHIKQVRHGTHANGSTDWRASAWWMEKKYDEFGKARPKLSGTRSDGHTFGQDQDTGRFVSDSSRIDDELKALGFDPEEVQ